MSDVTQILNQIEAGDPKAAEQLLPLVYDELRKLAAAKLAHEQPGQTLSATALVHEAYLRLLGGEPEHQYEWDGRAHFFAAAAEAMRRILVDRARRKNSVKHGGGRAREELPAEFCDPVEGKHDLLAIDEALKRLSEVDPQAAKLVELRYFAGLSAQQAAAAMGVSTRTLDRTWAYARSFLLRQIERGD